jgi:hypothetical protein
VQHIFQQSSPRIYLVESHVTHDFSRRVFGAEYKGEDLMSAYRVLAPHTTREIKESIVDSSYTEGTSNAKRKTNEGHTRARHRDRYKASVDRVVYAQISSSCSGRTPREHDPDDQTRPPNGYKPSR